MSARSKIEWTDATWSPTLGCDKVSPGCANCYAVQQANRNGAMGQPAYQGLTARHSNGMLDWTGVIRTLPERLIQPSQWKRPRRVFVDSMSDLFHEDVPSDFIAQVFEVMLKASQHTFQILTKRPERMRQLVSLNLPDLAKVGPNIWLGTSVEDQERADERVPILLRTPAAVRFLSCEPLLGKTHLEPWLPDLHHDRCQAWDIPGHSHDEETLDWVICGGESGAGARPMDLSWARSIVRQCQDACVPVFVKQLGACAYEGPEDDRTWYAYRQAAAGRGTLRLLVHSHGGAPTEWPEDLRVQEYPETVEVGQAALL